MLTIRTAAWFLLLVGFGCAADSPQPTTAGDDRTSLQQEISKEEAQRASIAQTAWPAQLMGAIGRYWAVPPGMMHLRTMVKIHLAPDGAVISTMITESSGNPTFDDSVVKAVFHASPLPLPSDPAAFSPNLFVCFSPTPQGCAR